MVGRDTTEVDFFTSSDAGVRTAVAASSQRLFVKLEVNDVPTGKPYYHFSEVMALPAWAR